MTPEFKAAWIADLKSGKYPKTQSYLKDDIGYCCLGVALCTAGIPFSEYGHEATGPTGGRSAINHWYDPAKLDSEGHAYNAQNELSASGRELLGIDVDAHTELININDENDTFDEVIEYIEANL